MRSKDDRKLYRIHRHTSRSRWRLKSIGTILNVVTADDEREDQTIDTLDVLSFFSFYKFEYQKGKALLSPEKIKNKPFF